MSSLSLGLVHQQQQTLSPRLQRAVRLLQMSSLDFSRETNNALESNPFLELVEGGMDEPGEHGDNSRSELGEQGAGGESLASSELAEWSNSSSSSDSFDSFMAVDGNETSHYEGNSDDYALDPLRPAPADNTGVIGDAEFGENGGFSGEGAEGVEGVERGHPLWSDEPSQSTSGTRQHADRGEFNVLDLQAAEESLADHLLAQLSLLPLSARDATIAESIVGSLDDDGYLRLSFAELAEVTALDPLPSDEELRVGLLQIQSLEPAGVGARNVQECLLLQLRGAVYDDWRELSQRIIKEQFALLAARDLNGLARQLGCPLASIHSALECIRRLDPRPGLRFGAAHTQYVTPDVIVRKVRGNWTAQLNPSIVPRIRLNRVYAEMFQRTRTAQHGELAVHLQEARWTVSNIEQRFATILSVAEAIISRQKQFLEFGPLAMKPLGLREIAEQVGVHESTVSRVTNNKYMATPLGVFEFKYFFSRAMATASGGECSATAIRGLIQDLVNAEAPGAPLSDAELARRLARQGIVVARRTVTKYRQLMHIESFENRRKLA